MPGFIFDKKCDKEKTSLRKITEVLALGKKLSVFHRGKKKSVPLLVTGAATLFMKPDFIPSEWDNYFSIYFVDIFEDVPSSMDYSTLSLPDFIKAIEDVRIQLGLNTFVLFVHSGPGVLGFEYYKQHSSKIIFCIIVATSPVWGERKDVLVSDYFKYNADADRLKQFEQAQKALPARRSFYETYNAKAAQFFRHPQEPKWSRLWEGVSLDIPLVERYFSLIQNYDIGKIISPVAVFKILLILGIYDYSLPPYAWTEDAKDLLANGIEALIFPESGHWPSLEEPELFTSIVLEFAIRNFPSLFFEENTSFPTATYEPIRSHL